MRRTTIGFLQFRTRKALNVLPLLFLFFSPMLLSLNPAFANDGAYARVIGDYDTDSGLYFEEISAREEKAGFLSSKAALNTVNIFVYNPATKAGRTLFPRAAENINFVFLESEYDAKEKQMKFLGRSDKGRNNANIESRRPVSTMLLETFDSRDNLFTVWKVEKAFGEPKALFTYAVPSRWHVDVKNRMIRLLTKNDASYKVTEFSW